MVHIEVIDYGSITDVVAMDWLLSDSISFDNVLAKAELDSNTRFKTFNTVLTAGAKYYVCARPQSSTEGYGELSNIFEIIAAEDNNVWKLLPTVVNVDGFTTSSDTNEHDLYSFVITVGEISYVSNAVIDKAVLLITDVDGTHIHDNEYILDNNNSFTVKDVILPDDRVLKFNVMVTLTSGDTSRTCSIIVRTKKVSSSFITKQSLVTSGDSFAVNTLGSGVAGDYLWKLFVTNDLNNPAYSVTNTNPYLEIPSNVLVKDRKYVLIVSSPGDSYESFLYFYVR